MTATKGKWSDFWLGGGKRDTTAKVHELLQVKRAVGNFVRIVTNDPKIQVRYNTGHDSFTDGKTVTISAAQSVDKLDVTVGLALHEASHCKLSQPLMEVTKAMLSPSRMMQNSIVPSAFGTYMLDQLKLKIRNSPVKDQITFEQFFGIYKDILNVMEDRRIDAWMYRNASGYRPYYEALYNEHFYSPLVDQALQQKEWSDPSVEHYIANLINLHNPNLQQDALPDLDKIYKQVDFQKIQRFDDQSGWSALLGQISQMNRGQSATPVLTPMLATALDVLATMLNNVADITYEPQGQGQGDEDDDLPFELVIDGNGNGGDTGNFDGNVKPLSDKQRKQLKELLEKQRKFIRGEISKEAISDKERQLLDQLDAAKSEIKDVGGSKQHQYGNAHKARCAVYHRVDAALVKNENFFLGGRYINPSSKRGVEKGTKLGQQLANKLLVTNEDRTLITTRQKSGQIDKRLLSGLGHGMEQIFRTIQIDTVSPVKLHLSLDASGSMEGTKWESALACATALAYCSTLLTNFDVVITTRGGSHRLAHIAVVFDSAVDKFDKVKRVFPYLSCEGDTPEGLTFEAIMELLTQEQKRQVKKYFVNFSDGAPGHGSYQGHYGGEFAVEHTRQQVQKMRDAGINVLSYFISDHGGSNMNEFKRMYGKDAVTIDVTQVMPVARTINTLLRRG